MILDENDKAFLIEHIETAKALLNTVDVDALLEELDGFMTEHGYGPESFDELNDLGREAERVYDRIYQRN